MWRSARTSLHPYYSALVWSVLDPFHFLHLPHSICCLPFLSNRCGYTQLNFKNQLCRRSGLRWFYYNCLALNRNLKPSSSAPNTKHSAHQPGRYYPLIWQNQATGRNNRLTLKANEPHLSILPVSQHFAIRPILDPKARLVGHALVIGQLNLAQVANSQAIPTGISWRRWQRQTIAPNSIGSWHLISAALTYKVLDSGLPSYLSSQLSHYHPARELRSSSSNLLAQPYSSTKFGSLAFKSCAPKIWNELPLEVKSAQSLQTFKSRLKTHYFRKPLA